MLVTRTQIEQKKQKKKRKRNTYYEPLSEQWIESSLEFITKFSTSIQNFTSYARHPTNWPYHI